MSLRVEQIKVSYPDRVIGPVDFEVPDGDLMCLLGPNGAGKTSILKAILGLTRAEGLVELNGSMHRPGAIAVRRSASWASDSPDAIPATLTALELIRFHAWCGRCGVLAEKAAVGRALEIAERLSLDAQDRRLIGTFSMGMKKKLQLICCLMRRPAVVIVDEPRNSLDPVTADEVASLLREERNNGSMVIAATHDLDFAERESTSVVVLVGGCVKIAGTPAKVLGPDDSRQRYRDLVTDGGRSGDG
ncbi:MAG: ABC transporter ATP-binding protein [Bifidobacteriaceae bacterium]|jgi:ABC-type multidrug transport system ATPase subunit|nr:ABC transporter ATP-binding protein [Bifidobacteriaceae bacterium]